MSRASRAALAARAFCVALWGRWREDREGASLVQFALVMPLLVLVVLGMFGIFTMYSARQTLCEAVYEATRYLQVEGPQFNEDEIPYPSGWQEIAARIINQELKSNRMTMFPDVTPSDVEITPIQKPSAPRDMREVTFENVEHNWFFVDASATITNPLWLFLEDSELGVSGNIRLSCKSTGFYEGEPIGPTPGAGGDARKVRCPKPPVCSPGPPPTETPEGTPPPTCPPCSTPRGRP